MKRATRLPDVFSAGELARVTGLPVRQMRALIRATAIPTVDGALVARHDAFRACRALLDGRLTAPVSGSGSGLLSHDRTDSTRTGRSTGVSLLVSGSVHAAVLAAILLLATVAVPGARPDDARGTPPELVQLVFVVDPGPGGGGGSGAGVGVGPGTRAFRPGRWCGLAAPAATATAAGTRVHDEHQLNQLGRGAPRVVRPRAGYRHGREHEDYGQHRRVDRAGDQQ